MTLACPISLSGKAIAVEERTAKVIANHIAFCAGRHAFKTGDVILPSILQRTRQILPGFCKSVFLACSGLARRRPAALPNTFCPSAYSTHTLHTLATRSPLLGM